MSEKPTIHNFVTGKNETLPVHAAPDTAWITGWANGMVYGESARNPYPEGTNDYRNWLSGYDAAKED